MDMSLIVGIGAFVILGLMFALLWLSGRHDEKVDTVTQEIIVRANTAPVTVVANVTETQEKEN